MSKFDYEFKKKVVEAYFQGKGGYKTIADQFGIHYWSNVEKWVHLVRESGYESLKVRNTKSVYSSDFKLDVLNYYLTSGEGIKTVAAKYSLSAPSLISNWKKAYEDYGIAGLSPKQKGHPNLSKKIKKKPSAMKELSREKQLERENELLRAELAFIKKLRALGADIPKRLKNETHESSTNSEQSSD